jgi:hypothetical protein
MTQTKTGMQRLKTYLGKRLNFFRWHFLAFSFLVSPSSLLHIQSRQATAFDGLSPSSEAASHLRSHLLGRKRLVPDPVHRRSLPLLLGFVFSSVLCISIDV